MLESGIPGVVPSPTNNQHYSITNSFPSRLTSTPTITHGNSPLLRSRALPDLSPTPGCCDSRSLSLAFVLSDKILSFLQLSFSKHSQLFSPLSSIFQLLSCILHPTPCLSVTFERTDVPTNFAVMCEYILSLEDPVPQMINTRAYQPGRTLSKHSSDCLSRHLPLSLLLRFRERLSLRRAG